MVKRYILSFFILVFVTLMVSAQDEAVNVSSTTLQPYLGQPFIYTVTYISTDDLSQAQIQSPDFFGFSQYPNSTTISVQAENGLSLNVIEQTITLYATRVGNLVIEPTSINLPETPFQSGKIIESIPLTINVLALPEDTPDTFTGAVGQFDMNVALKSPIIQAGEPNLFSVSITGSGNFDQITSPHLPLPDTWEVIEDRIIFSDENQNVQTKTFQYQIFADQTGNTAIPAIQFTFFDPLTASYKTITSQEMAFTVDGEFTAQNQVSSHIDNTRQLPLKPISAHSNEIIPAIGFWILWGIPPIVVLIIVLVQFISRPRQEQPRRRRKQSQPLKTAIAQLTQAQQQSPTEIYSIVEQTIIQYIAEAYQQDINTVNQAELINGLSEKIQERTFACLEQAQSGQYAPVTQNDANKLLRRTYKTLHLIEEERS
jgi:hypothetical protein